MRFRSGDLTVCEEKQPGTSVKVDNDKLSTVDKQITEMLKEAESNIRNHLHQYETFDARVV